MKEEIDFIKRSLCVEDVDRRDRCNFILQQVLKKYSYEVQEKALKFKLPHNALKYLLTVEYTAEIAYTLRCRDLESTVRFLRRIEKRIIREIETKITPSNRICGFIYSTLDLFNAPKPVLGVLLEGRLRKVSIPMLETRCILNSYVEDEGKKDILLKCDKKDFYFNVGELLMGGGGISKGEIKRRCFLYDDPFFDKFKEDSMVMSLKGNSTTLFGRRLEGTKINNHHIISGSALDVYLDIIDQLEGANCFLHHSGLIFESDKEVGELTSLIGVTPEVKELLT